MIDIKFSRQVERNLLGIQLEKEGKIEEAVQLYEQNIAESFIGDHPYNRLRVIYKKQKKIDDIIRVLEKAIYVFDDIVSDKRADRNKKLEKFKEQLLVYK